MAEFVSGLAVLVLHKLSSISYKEICLATGLKSDLKRLGDSMSNIEKDVLRHAEETQVHNWLTQLNDVFLDAAEVLDEFECEKQRRKSVKKHGSAGRKVRRFFSRSNPLVFHRNLAKTVKEIRGRLDQIATECRNFNLNQRSEERHKISKNGREDSYVDASTVIGREADKAKIINLLIDQAENSNSLLSVIPIYGFPGMGKTTLTRLVYNDDEVNRWFDVQMWVSVSKVFDIPRLIRKMLDSATGKKNEAFTDDQSQAILRDLLNDKKILLVLDDVWNEDWEKWRDLKSFLTGCSKGSKIIVTTRNEVVAKHMGTASCLQELKGLSDGDSRTLFLKCAFKEGQDIKPHQNLTNIAQRIVKKKCNGIPWAVITLGDLLSSHLNEQYWSRVEKTEIWKLHDFMDKVFTKLQESYNDLPFHLKRCFQYCSLFPEREEIFSWELIQLWMAHGVLVVEENDNRSLEDIGHQYLRELYSRSFFQSVQNYGWCFSFSMYYFIHDFAMSVSRKDCLIVKNSYTDVPNHKVRHLSIVPQQAGGNGVPTIPSSVEISNSVRTILFPLPTKKPFATSSFSEYLIKNYVKLRMLDLSNSSIETLSSHIGRMKLLRCLNLSHNRKLAKLPRSISKLQSLQSLQLEGCSNLEKLPRNIKNLSASLVSLSITTSEEFFPVNEIQLLTSLQTLTIVECNKLLYLPDTMACLTALKTLVIRRCKKLCLFDDEHNKVEDFSLQKLILLELPQALALPRWLQGCKQSLQFLGLYSCPNLTELPVWLPNMASLQEIEVMKCPDLQSLPEGMRQLTSLEQFIILDSPKLEEYINTIVWEDWHKKIHFQNTPEQQSKRKEPSEIGDSGRTQKVWTEDENAKLIQTISELYSKGKLKVEDNFMPGDHSEAIKRLLVAKLPGSDHRSTKHIESQIKSLKTAFHIVHEILTGPDSNDFRWDLEKNMVTAKTTVWDTYTQSHPEAKPFRDKAFPFYKELSAIFGEDAASATRKGLEIILADEVEESRRNSVEGEDVKADNIKSNFLTEAPQTDPSLSTVGFGDIGEAIKEAAHVIAVEIRDSRNLQKQGLSQEINEKIMRLNNELMKITTLTVTERHKATHLISQNNNTVSIFYSLPDEEKEQWVRALLNGFV